MNNKNRDKMDKLQSYSYSGIPFRLDLPEDIQARLVVDDLYKLVAFESKTLKFNLAWSPYVGPLSLPEGYQPLEDVFVEILDETQLPVQLGILTVNNRVGRALMHGFVRGVVLWSVLYFLFQISIIWTLVAAVLVTLSLATRKYFQFSAILKYVFRIEEMEYVFSIPEKHIKRFEEILKSMDGSGFVSMEQVLRWHLEESERALDAGRIYDARESVFKASKLADDIGSDFLVREVRRQESRIAGFFRGGSRALSLHQELVSGAKSLLKQEDQKNLDHILELIGLKNYQQAMEEVQQLRNKYSEAPIQALLLFLGSNIHRRRQEVDQEIASLSEFLDINPNHPLAEHNLGNAYSAKREYERAERHYLNAIEALDGNYPLAICNLGLLYVKMGRIIEAKEKLSRAEGLNAPENSLNALRKRLGNSIV